MTILTGLFLFTTAAMHAATVTWSGTIDTNWGTGGVGGNWGNDAVPTATDRPYFNSAFGNAPNIGTSSYSIESMSVGSSGPASFTLNGSSGNLMFDSAASYGNSLITLAANKSLTVDANVKFYILGTDSQYAPYLYGATGSVLTFSAGKTLTVEGGSSRSVQLRDGTVNINGTVLAAGATSNNFSLSSGYSTTLNWNPESGGPSFGLTSRGGGIINIYKPWANLNFGSSVNPPAGTIMIKDSFTNAGGTNLIGNSAGTAVFGLDDGTSASVSTTLSGIFTLSQADNSIAEILVGTNDTLTLSGQIYNNNYTSGNSAGTIFRKTGEGHLILSGATANTYANATEVTAGTLLVNKSINGTGAVTVSVNAILGGNGTLAGATTINGILAPGNSFGQLTIANDVTWNANNAWKFELGTSVATQTLADAAADGANDRLYITGGASSDFLKGTGTTFTFDFLGTGAPGWYKLVDWTGTTPSTFANGDFLSSNFPRGLGGKFVIDDTTKALYLYVYPVHGSIMRIE